MLDIDAIVSLPGSPPEGDNHNKKGDSVKEGEKELEKGKNEVTVDEACWIKVCLWVLMNKVRTYRVSDDLHMIYLTSLLLLCSKNVLVLHVQK